jgi:predicted dehydrogenase
MRVGIIGCGLIGRKRALALETTDIIVACCDTNKEVGKKFAEDFNCKFYCKYLDLLANTNCDIIIVAVINKNAQKIVSFSLKMGRYVLVEKPMGMNYKESEKILDDVNENKSILKVGFNHRFHPALLKAKQLFDINSIGKLLIIKGNYGHGGRPGMENEWRSSKELCGGGELLDQGVHLIDLSRWFAGDIKKVFGKIRTKFWDIEVEDNAFMLLKSKSNVDIQLHVSWTNWKNSFSFELYGTEGYLKINGLGGSYGKETLEFGKRKKEGGIPEIEHFEFDEKDTSWNKEWLDFKSSINNNREPIGNVVDGSKANQIIDAIYKSSKKNKFIKI